jgi:4-amino-4-deoxy-L-arabinose transferase-like glycosyltransferase
LLFAAALALFLPGFFSIPPIDRDEARFVQASRQMIESGDYLDIRFQDRARYNKPIGVYWLQAAAALASGEGASAPVWVFRLVSLAGALAAVLLAAWAGAALFGPRAAFLGALALAGCLLLGLEARMAKTDALLLASVVLAQGVLARFYLAEREGRDAGLGLALLFWLVMGLSILIKGPIGPMVAVLTLLALGFADRRWRWMLSLRPLAGLPLALAVCLPWLAAITWLSDGAFLEKSLGGDLLGKLLGGQESHGAPPGYYLLSFWLSSWPFGYLVLAAVLLAWSRRAQPAVRFCLAWLLPAWLLFELVPTKLPHYTLPLFPALFLLLAWRLVERPESRESPIAQGLRKAGWGLFALSNLVFAVAVLVLPHSLGEGFDWWTLPILAALAAVTLTGLELKGPARPEGRIWLMLAAAFAAYFCAFQQMLPGFQPLWLSPRAAIMAESLKPCPQLRLAAAGYTEPSLAILAGSDTLLGSAEQAADFLRADPACALAMIEGRAEPAFRGAARGLQIEAVGQLEGINYSRGQEVRLTFYRVRGP